jgi:hypothetical protein
MVSTKKKERRELTAILFASPRWLPDAGAAGASLPSIARCFRPTWPARARVSTPQHLRHPKALLRPTSRGNRYSQSDAAATIAGSQNRVPFKPHLAATPFRPIFAKAGRAAAQNSSAEVAVGRTLSLEKS